VEPKPETSALKAVFMVSPLPRPFHAAGAFYLRKATEVYPGEHRTGGSLILFSRSPGAVSLSRKQNQNRQPPRRASAGRPPAARRRRLRPEKDHVPPSPTGALRRKESTRFSPAARLPLSEFNEYLFAAVHESAFGRYCCKKIFGLGAKNAFFKLSVNGE
jgi:hypothetical protein